jgi:hypothetical protein
MFPSLTSFLFLLVLFCSVIPILNLKIAKQNEQINLFILFGNSLRAIDRAHRTIRLCFLPEQVFLSNLRNFVGPSPFSIVISFRSFCHRKVELIVIGCDGDEADAVRFRPRDDLHAELP